MARVTVCMPIKNAAETITRTAKSLLNQTFEDWTLVALDNGSTDHSAELLRGVFETSGVANKLNLWFNAALSLPEARHKLSSAGDSEYIAVLDADDQFHPRKLERQIAIMAHEQDFSLCGTAALWFADKRLGRFRYEKVTSVFRPDEYQYPRLDSQGMQHARLPHSSFFFRREHYERSGGYRAFHPVAHDHDLMLRMSELGTVYCIQKPLVRYCVRDGAISAERRREQVRNSIVSYANLLLRRQKKEEICEILEEASVFERLRQLDFAAEASFLEAFFASYLRSMVSARKVRAT